MSFSVVVVVVGRWLSCYCCWCLLLLASISLHRFRCASLDFFLIFSLRYLLNVAVARRVVFCHAQAIVVGCCCCYCCCAHNYFVLVAVHLHFSFFISVCCLLLGLPTHWRRLHVHHHQQHHYMGSQCNSVCCCCCFFFNYFTLKMKLHIISRHHHAPQ